MIEEGICGKSVLRDAASEVFEMMMFMSIREAAVPPEGFAETSCVLSTISFQGNYEGTMTLTCTRECAQCITMNVLALDSEEEVMESDIPDAMGELTNMVMGAVKSKLYKSVGELSVTVPSVISGKTMHTELREGDKLIESDILIDETYKMTIKLIYQ